MQLSTCCMRGLSIGHGKKEEHPEESMREAFKVFDKDGNGYVSREELKRIMTELGDEPLSPEELDVLMNNFDDDGDGRINYDGNVFLFKNI